MQRKPTRAVAPTLYLTEDELPPALDYIVWGDSNSPFITEYRPRLRRGAGRHSKFERTDPSTPPSIEGLANPHRIDQADAPVDDLEAMRCPSTWDPLPSATLSKASSARRPRHFTLQW